MSKDRYVGLLISAHAAQAALDEIWHLCSFWVVFFLHPAARSFVLFCILFQKGALLIKTSHGILQVTHLNVLITCKFSLILLYTFLKTANTLK